MAGRVKFCVECGDPLRVDSTECPYCGAPQPGLSPAFAARVGPPLLTHSGPSSDAARFGERFVAEALAAPERAVPVFVVAQPPTVSRTTAGLLALFLGWFGVHKFYLGRWGLGLVYLLFFWTAFPALFAFVEALWIFSMKDEEFWREFG
ncbi:TM2 domain-containing membrane protein YozV [Roseiarcus fermentans]|uniref:TM2 domain-containing membrane protein YozV n=1 Tax=Roseiarcus fermentans TaxID=1473586 RepID=A0A366EQP3_9HYPH|nr:TM2 domain-containing protein [Roseiarcus fermentans]RBP03805.1 TM2 domain-containing membrane protein YozV [Roseiarcus fermentans]